jgi:hypothetical protein
VLDGSTSEVPGTVSDTSKVKYIWKCQNCPASKTGTIVLPENGYMGETVTIEPNTLVSKMLYKFDLVV